MSYFNDPDNKSPSSPASTPTYTSSNDIAEMQSLMKIVSETITGASSVGQKSDLNKSNMDAFNNFVINKGKTGEELNLKNQIFENEQIAKEYQGKVRQFNQMLENLKGTGMAGKEFTADGVWGPKTNNALYNIDVYVDLLEKVASDFKIQSVRRPEHLEIIPGSPDDVRKESASSKNTKAKQNIKILKEIKVFCNTIINQVVKDPKRFQYLSGATHISLGKSKELSQADKGIVSNYLNEVDDKKAQYLYRFKPDDPGIPDTINPYYLTSMDKFKQWVKSIGKNPEHPAILKRLLELIKKGQLFTQKGIEENRKSDKKEDRSRPTIPGADMATNVRR